MKILICSYADNYYYDYIYVLMKSAVHFIPDEEYNCLLINCSYKQAEAISKLSKNMHVSRETVLFDDKHIRRSYMYRKRIQYIDRLIYNNQGNVLFYLDADSIIRKNDPELKKFLIEYDMAMRVMNLDKTTMKQKSIPFAGSTLILRCNLAAFKFWSAFTYLNEGDYTRLATQSLLSSAYNEVREKINFCPIPREYCNPWHEDSAVIWEGNGQKKRQNGFINEMRRINEIHT